MEYPKKQGYDTSENGMGKANGRRHENNDSPNPYSGLAISVAGYQHQRTAQGNNETSQSNAVGNDLVVEFINACQQKDGGSAGGYAKDA